MLALCPGMTEGSMAEELEAGGSSLAIWGEFGAILDYIRPFLLSK